MKKLIPTVFWLTGLSGAGKTTIGKLLADTLRARGEPVVFLDGDVLREVYDDQFGHDRLQRLRASEHYARLCNMLVKQKVHVICATISLFHQIQQWNRKNIEHYCEIFVDVPLQELVMRDNKKIYSRGLKGELNNIVGLDIEPEYPIHPDMIISNFANMTADEAVSAIIKYVERRYASSSTIETW